MTEYKSINENKKWLVIGDLHLTSCHQTKSERAWVRRLKRIVSTKEIDSIIILGDLYDRHQNKEIVQKEHPSLFTWLKTQDAIYVTGNNDKGDYDKVVIESSQEGVWPIVLIHGHQFFLCYKFDFLWKWLARLSRKKPKYNLNFSMRMFKWAEKNKTKLILAHTHIADEQCHYYNCGSFAEQSCYIIISKNNFIRLYERT